MDITDVWEKTLRRAAVSTRAGKMVVRPSLVDALEIHNTSSLHEGYTMLTIPSNLTYMIHARRHTVEGL